MARWGGMSDRSSDATTQRSSSSDEFRDVWATLPLDSETREAVPSLTIPVDHELCPEPSDPALAVTKDVELPSLVVLRVLGEGGMGVVHLARQATLHREVAVKTAKSAGVSTWAARALREEALITANLQHPNIIPIYAMEETEDGHPRIVMKRVEGTVWSDVLDGSAPLPEEAVADPLRWHIELLVRVATAIEYAHSRGILHRDLKPENVMLGRFGEMYVLDWGLAVSMREEDRGVLPMATDVKGIAGTPMYMAPEMTLGTGSALGVHTDVYLLGAVLHEVLTGEPPHVAQTVYEAMRRAYVSEAPTFGGDVPPELASICRRALAREASDRFGSAEELRAALVGYLRHRTSNQLSEQASHRLERLRALVGGEADGDDDRTVRDLFAEARFGYEQALREWPDNGVAKAGLAEAVRQVVMHEVRTKNLEAARSYLAMLESPSPDLQGAVTALADELAAQHRTLRELERRAREVDRTMGASGRALAAILFGVGASASLVLIDWADHAGVAALTHTAYLGWLVILALGTTLVVHAFRHVLLSNEVNRQVVYGTASVVAAVVATRFAIFFSDLPVRLGFRFELVVYGMGFAMLAVVSNYRVFTAAVMCLIGAVLDAALQTERLHVLAASLFMAFAALAWAWASAPTSPR